MATTYIYRTAGTPTSSKKFTISAWIKIGNIGTEQHIFGAFDDTSNRTHFVLTDTGGRVPGGRKRESQLSVKIRPPTRVC